MSIRFSCSVAARASPLPLGALVSLPDPQLAVVGPHIAASGELPRCPVCRAVTAFGTATCAFCGHARNDAVSQQPPAAPSSTSEPGPKTNTASTHVVDYPVTIGDGVLDHPVSRRVSSFATDAARGVGQDTVFIVDRSIAKDDMDKLQSVILEALAHLHPSALVGFVVAGAAVSVYELGLRDPANMCATSEFFSPSSPLGLVEADLIQTHERTANSCFLASASAVRDTLDCVLGTLVACSRGDMLKTRRKDRLKHLRANRRRRDAKSNARERRKTTRVKDNDVLSLENTLHAGGAPPARSIYKATEVACALLRAQHCDGGHIIIFATGPETSATNTARKAIGREIADAGIIVSTFLPSSGLVDVSGFEPLVQGPPSSIILHSSFNDKTFPENVHRAIRRVAAMNVNVTPSDHSLAIAMNLTIRCSSGLHLVQVIGAASAATAATASGDEATAASATDHLTNLRVSARGGAIALYFDLDEQVPNSRKRPSDDDAEYVQIIMDAILLPTEIVGREDLRCVRRVITKRLRLTKDMSTHLTSMDPQITSVMMAKMAVLSGDLPGSSCGERDNTDATGAHTDERSAVTTDVRLRSELRRMAEWVYTFRQGGVSKVAPFPLELLEVARTFYHACCGPLCNGHVHHIDEMTLARTRFRCADSSMCLRMMMPELWMLPAAELLAARNKANLDVPSLFKEAPLSSLSLRSDCILVLDSETQTIIWSGAMMAGVEFDPARAQILEEWEKITQDRFPKPNIIIAKEGSSEARSLLAFLEPSHRDSPFVQLKSVPELGSLEASELRKLRKKLPHSEEETFTDYLANVLAYVSK